MTNIYPVFYGTRNFHSLIKQDKNKARKILDYVINKSPIQTIITAPHYDNGLTEIFLGDNFAVKRSDFAIATSVGITHGENGTEINLSKHNIEDQLQGILKRYQTDFVDILQLHHDDLFCSVSDTADYLHALRDQGTIKSIGVTNFTLDRLKLWSEVLDIDYIQLPINFLQLQSVEKVIKFCRSKNIKVIAHSIFGLGLLSRHDLSNTDLFPYLVDSIQQNLLKLNQEFQKSFLNHNIKISDILFPWLKMSDYADFIAFGSQNIENIKHNINAFETNLNPKHEQMITEYVDKVKKLLPQGLLLPIKVETIFRENDLIYTKFFGTAVLIPETVSVGDVVYINEGNGEILTHLE